MTDTANRVVDGRLLEALEGYFNGVRLDRTVGDCNVLTAIRKQNGAPVDIYTPSHAASRDDAVVDAIAKDFATFEKLGNRKLQASERLLASRAFRKSPVLALLSCPVAVFDEAFDLHPVDFRLRVLDEVLEGLAALHGAGLVHGNLSDRVVRREDGQAALKLCDFTFSGGRATVVTDQPVAYQTRNVVNTATPKVEDDIHAAGMLGYRIRPVDCRDPGSGHRGAWRRNPVPAGPQERRSDCPTVGADDRAAAQRRRLLIRRGRAKGAAVGAA